VFPNFEESTTGTRFFARRRPKAAPPVAFHDGCAKNPLAVQQVLRLHRSDELLRILLQIFFAQ